MELQLRGIPNFLSVSVGIICTHVCIHAHTAKNNKISILKIVYNFVPRTQKIDRKLLENFKIIPTYFKHLYICILQFFIFLILFSSLHLVLVSGESCHSLSKSFISPRLSSACICPDSCLRLSDLPGTGSCLWLPILNNVWCTENTFKLNTFLNQWLKASDIPKIRDLFSRIRPFAEHFRCLKS